MSNPVSNVSEQSLATDEAFSYDVDDTQTVTEAVLNAVTAVTGDTSVPVRDDVTDSSSLPPLYTVVDPDALDSLFHPTRSGEHATGYIQFQYANCTVVVESTGRILVRRETDELP